MCVSSSICDDNLDTLFGLVSKDLKLVSSEIKITIVCAIGDLVRRFTNTMVDRQEKIFELLLDDDPKVREQSLYVLSHLILTGAILIRDKIVDICVLLDDPQAKNANIVENLLQELHSKD